MLRIILDCNNMKFNEKFTDDEDIKDCLIDGKYTPLVLKESKNETMEHLKKLGMSGYGYLLGDCGCMLTRDMGFCTDEALELFGDIILVKYLTNEYVSVRNLIANGVVHSANVIYRMLQIIDFDTYTVNDPRNQYIGQSCITDGEYVTIVGFEYYKNENLIFKYNDKFTDCLGQWILKHDSYIHPKFRESVNKFMVISVKDFLEGKIEENDRFINK